MGTGSREHASGEFTLDREKFVEALRDSAAYGLDERSSLYDLDESASRAIDALVSLAQDKEAITQPDDLAGLGLEIVVYAYGEYEGDLLVAVRPRLVDAPGVPAIFPGGQVVTLLEDVRIFGPRNERGVRMRGVEALASTVEDVLRSANGLLPMVRAIAASGGGRDAVALDTIAAILRDPEWGAGMLEDIADVVASTGRSLANASGEATWARH